MLKLALFRTARQFPIKNLLKINGLEIMHIKTIFILCGDYSKNL
jgi:hypothetical protein